MTEKSLVSLLIPTKNSEAYIKKCIKSIRNQNYPNVEIIVVDNYSRDKTREIAQKYGARIYLRGSERASQVNYGVLKARGKYIYRVDSDFFLEPAVVKEAVHRCEQGYDAVAVHNTSDSSVSLWAKVRKLERDCYRNSSLNVAARFMRKDCFEAIGGYDESLIAAEDYDLHDRLLKMGYKIGRIRAQEIHLGEPRSLREIVHKHFYYGKTFRKYLKKSGGPYRHLNPIRLTYLKHWRSFLKNPDLTLCFILYQFVRYFSALIGLIAEK